MAIEMVRLSAILDIGGDARGTAATGWLLGPYRLLDRLGAGAYAAVYRAIHELMGVERAVKVLRPRAAEGETQRIQFLREARVAARLRHRNVVTVHDCGIAADGTPYIAMEYVAGRSLAARLEEGSPPAAETLAVAGQIADALDHAHGMGVVHRDVKPGNVILGDDGVVRLVDFGIAQAGREPGEPGEPWAGLGTPAYMAPEQRLGRRAGSHTDVYSLAVVLHEMLTGHARAIDPGLPAAVAEVLARGLAAEPARRPAGAGVLVSALAVALGATPPSAGPRRRFGPLRRLRSGPGRGAGRGRAR
jgi:eukaryotic-like serine/threonine-protein kinase